MIRNKLMALAVAMGMATPVAAQEITVGGKGFTEQLILAEMTTRLLEANGFEVEKADGMGTTVVRQALESGAVDLYWEYTGTSLVTFNKVEERLSPEETYQRVKELDGEKGLVWLAPSNANNTYALAIRKDDPVTEGMATLSDLAAAYSEGRAVLMATTAEFPRRDDGLLGLQETYAFEAGRANIRPMDGGLVFDALSSGNVNVAVVGATDGRIAAMDLQLLGDDKSFFPNYALVPVVRAEVLEANPQIGTLLEDLSGRLNDATMQRLNGMVDVNGQSVEQVAETYLSEEGLL
ncbi:glycine betaine ABC transporter substrate-binding protein [Sulfitobacter mediterraneus]|uniref:glycine betaine ABC transporter substrate-binding protein n=1 Tax=Sulfitobacter mediterraneus TaxID=83219 RepID=UPI00193325C0|nr:glycine betaine ABC transporter substrate-binding protein [Sulfitobacter mediterraneus]MBM1634333.1 glycine betaine ABC transporter substrate-binding protein [Sulfitobacter mediterraneus]MBM1642150.1 glycine betaine ABC transporter substrate-binding protein [Sulfitobacter mediterraneus]MBM1646199.1 glycine betaine ABC transporter substrate-binding protein [Sulfitobacter mediterraneus]MBM1650245.1 glycine betaine ABC transporter substrate-binding protein [Sulfitobacter mediterraneus]MBM16542